MFTLVISRYITVVINADKIQSLPTEKIGCKLCEPTWKLFILLKLF